MSDKQTTIGQEWPVGSWIPHKPATWPFRFATVKEPTKLRDWDGKRDLHGAPVFVERWVPAGTKVKIVMVSRFGDVGITDDLNAEQGYCARVDLSDLEAMNV